MAKSSLAREISQPTVRPPFRRTDYALRKDMSCEAALCAIGRGCGADLKRYGRKAARGDAEALHRIRIALTRLRAAIRFFSPAVNNSGWTSVLQQASRLGRQSGAVRDIDVALEHHRQTGAANQETKRWREERDTLLEQLRRSLHSVRYRRFIETLSKRSAPPSSGPGPRNNEDASLQNFTSKRLDRWQRKLLRNGRKLDRMGWRERHRLRLRAKRFRYALEWSSPLLPESRNAQLKRVRQAKVIQSALGRSNDACVHQEQAEARGIDPLSSMARLGRQKTQRRFLGSASRALEALGRLQQR